MKKLKFIILRPRRISLGLTIFFLIALILIGGGCGEEKLDKKLSESEMKAVLEKTVQDLGWSNVNVANKERTDGAMSYECRNTYDTALNKYINITITDVSNSESSKGDYAKNACEKTKNMKVKDVLSTTIRKIDTKVINLSGFDVCYYEYYSDYGKQCKTCVSCADVKSARAVIGNYRFSIFSHVTEDNKEIICNPVDPVPLAETLINNLLKVLR